MKKNYLKGLFIVAIAGLVGFTGCKYDEGPGISLKAKRDRFANEWIINSYEVDNGTDVKDMTDVVKDTALIREYGNVVFLTTRSGDFKIVEMPNERYDFNDTVWYNDTYNVMKGMIKNISEAFGWSNGTDTFDFKAPQGKYTFDDKFRSVIMERDLAIVDTLEHRQFEIVKLREDELWLKWTDESDVVRKLQFTPLNDEDFFL